MTRIRTSFVVGLVFAALLLLVFGGTTAVSFPLWLRYRNAAGLSTARSIAQIAAGLAAVGFFITAAMIASAAALEPAGRWRKLLLVLPIYLLGFTLAGVVAYAAGIGTVGPFTTVWVGAGALLSMVAVIIAAVRLPLGAQTMRRAITALGVTGALSGLAWLGVLASLAIVLTSQPSAVPFGPGGLPGAPGGEIAPTAAAAAPAPTTAAGQAELERRPRARGPQGSSTPLLIGVVLMALFGAIEWGSIWRAWGGSKAAPSDLPQAPPIDRRHEAGRAVLSCIAITIVALAVAQLIPIKRDNPPAQTAVQWDSPQSEKLVRRACLDCHSNDTTWPWYAYVAPGSWLLRSHVSSAREELNFSALNSVSAFRASELPEEVAQQIRTGAMPPKDYLLLHPEARLSDAEKQQLIQGLQQSLANSLPR